MYIARTAKNEGKKSGIIGTEWNGGCRSGGGVRQMGRVGKRVQISSDKTKSEDLMYNVVIKVDNTVLCN